MKQLLEVGADRIVAEVQREEGAEAHEGVVGEDGQPVVGQGQGDQLETVGEHGGVQVLDLVVGQVQVPQGLGHVSQSTVGHHLELVVIQVQRLQLRVSERVAWQRPQPEN